MVLAMLLLEEDDKGDSKEEKRFWDCEISSRELRFNTCYQVCWRGLLLVYSSRRGFYTVDVMRSTE